MQLTMYQSCASAVWAEALFVSVLQRSSRPSPGQVKKAITAAVRAHGSRGCAELVAQEFGDHPETAAERMCWARAVVGEVLAPPPGVSVPGPRRRQLVRT